jgi:hypothetical protein
MNSRTELLKGRDAGQLRPSEFAVFPLWEFAPESDEHDECWMIPVTEVPVNDLVERCLGTEVSLADGSRVWAVIYELWPLTLEGTIKSQRFRFFNGNDVCDWPKEEFQPGTVNSAELAAFLDRKVEEVFPFAYDVSNLVAGDTAVTKRSVSVDEENQKFWHDPPDPVLVESFLRAIKP